MQWPKQGEQLFRADADWHLNACINCYPPLLSIVASSYREGAEVLARATADGKATLDLAILPIVFLYRHYLELTIKDVIDTLRSLEGEGEGYPQHHNLKNLWSEATRLVRMHYGQRTPPEFDRVQSCIDEFEVHDPESFSFRYPTDKKGKAALRGIKHINVRHLYETMERVSALLEGIGCDLHHKLDLISEMQSGYDPYYG